MTVVIEASAGAYVVRLDNFEPSPRAADDPWTRINVQEAASSSGPWNDLGTGDISPVDADPESPAAQDIEVRGAEFLTGWYLVTFLDADGNEQPVDPVYNGPQIRPSVREIGALLHSRTTIDGGAEAGTFNDETDPTGQQVDDLIDVALDQIAIQLPDALTDKQVAFARRMVGYQAAILVENAHFPEQVESGNSLASMYQEFLDAGLLTLTGSIDGDIPGGPSAFSITTQTDTQYTLERCGRVSRDPYCSPWTSY